MSYFGLNIWFRYRGFQAVCPAVVKAQTRLDRSGLNSKQYCQTTGSQSGSNAGEPVTHLGN